MKTRIWIYWNGFVRVTLTEGQTLTLHTHGPTDEGYRSYTERYTLDADGIITCESESYESDCDGRHESYRSCWCHKDNDLVPTRDYGIMVPCWRKGEASQRDAFAEAMGY